MTGKSHFDSIFSTFKKNTQFRIFSYEYRNTDWDHLEITYGIILVRKKPMIMMHYANRIWKCIISQ